MKEAMKTGPHGTIRQVIDKMLAGAASPYEEQALCEHLQACAECREYLAAGTRAIAGLSGFSFHVDPALQAKVLSSLARQAPPLGARLPVRLEVMRNYAIALMLTAAGALATLQLGGLAAAALGVQPGQVRQGLIDFWILPSFCFTFLFPILPLFSAIRINRRGRAL